MTQAALDAEFSAGHHGFHLEFALQIQPGETVVLVGPSGSGKTTTLLALAGLLSPQAGRIHVGDQVAFDPKRRINLPPWKRRVGVMFQDYALFPHLSVARNIAYGLRGTPNAERRVGQWLEAVGLEEFAHRKPSELSGGQQQRVALARAAATDAALLLLDEPFGALDAGTRRRIRGEFRRILEQAMQADSSTPARGTLLITHDHLDALTLGDRIAVLEEGRLSQVGTRSEILRRPRTPFLAELTGHNVLAGWAEPAEAGSDLRRIRVGSMIFFSVDSPDLPQGNVFLSFAPHEVSLMPGRSTISARNQFAAVVTEIVELPDRLRVHLDAGVPLMVDLVRSAAADLSLSPGRRVIAAVKSTAIDVYK